MRVDAIRAGQEPAWFHELPDASTDVQALPAVILRSSDLELKSQRWDARPHSQSVRTVEATGVVCEAVTT